MKKITLFFCIAIFVATAFSFKAIYDLKKSTAEVEQTDGLYIFTDSKPGMEYTVIGEVKLPMAYGKEKKHINVKQSLIEKAKKNYPTAEGIIIIYEKLEMEKAIVIDFKE